MSEELVVEKCTTRYDGCMGHMGPIPLEAVKVTEENILGVEQWIRQKTLNDRKPSLDITTGVEKAFSRDPTFFIGDWIVLLEGKFWANWSQSEFETRTRK